ncbi:MAG: prephenate dehydratase [Alphaproteobacteria bacterium]|nr:prephenate dehydratase [Alphaproteobacteria bacterium]
MPDKTIAFQGAPGAYSHLACREVFPELTPLPCVGFEDAFAAVTEGRAACAMIPIENSMAGRVADVHHLLPRSELGIVGEHFLRVHHQLLAPHGATLAGLKTVRSHVQGLAQCREFIRKHKLNPVVHADTAGAARDCAMRNDLTEAAIASKLAAETYDLAIVAGDIEDQHDNTTRFIILAKDGKHAPASEPHLITSLIFQVKNVPAALYKALGGFATNAINVTRLESYIGPGFSSAQFYLDVEGHPESVALGRALDELRFFSTFLRILGVYKAHPHRLGK